MSINVADETTGLLKLRIALKHFKIDEKGLPNNRNR